MRLGNPAAKVTVIEYASVTCPHCAAFNEQVFPAFKAKYIDTNLVSYEFREFLTPPVSVAAAGFLVARCAGKDKYFSVIDTLFHSQNDMYGGDPRAMLFRIGRSAGMTDDKITACIQDQKALEALNKRVTKAVETDKITGTPTFVINGKALSGEQTMTALDAAIQPLLKQ
jgi:protein-disulfide isomerase